MGQTISQVDAFTDKPFAGNPAAVCVLDGPRDATWMQNVAREMNLSETAYVYPEEADPGAFRLRWFTPTVEVDICGHATLATAHVLWTEGHLAEGAPARFHTRSGLLTAEFRDGWVALDFPALPVLAPGAAPAWPLAGKDPSALADVMAGVVGAPVRFAGFSACDALVELDSESAVRAVKPDLARVASHGYRGLIVTARAETSGFDFVSRFFAPAVGIDEDPVCGSAHCCLGPYWGARLGKSDLAALQVSPRVGVLRVGLRGDRVRLAGRAVTVLRAELVGGAG
jgi:PhzF family phenazine biosynthesis protein